MFFNNILKILNYYIGKLKRKDETIRQALAEKQALVADMLNVPREDFETIADMAGEPALDKDPAELLLASVNQGTSSRASFLCSDQFFKFEFHLFTSPTWLDY